MQHDRKPFLANLENAGHAWLEGKDERKFFKMATAFQDSYNENEPTTRHL